MPEYPRSPFGKEASGIITQKLIDDTLKLLGENKTILSLGDSTHEGGNVEIYRDGSNNLALFFDADAASNVKGLDIYPGVVIRNHLTVGDSILYTAYPFRCVGYGYISRIVLDRHIQTIPNATRLDLSIPIISGTANHAISLQIDYNDVLCVQATGDGAGGIVDLKVIVKEQLVYTPSSDIAITAAGGITVTKAIMRVAGDGSAIDITANPQIAAGTDGQVVIIQGTHDTNTVTLDDGTGLALSAQCVLAAQDNITLMYDSGDSEWIETSRTTVV
jgi:hypothetical protein